MPGKKRKLSGRDGPSAKNILVRPQEPPGRDYINALNAVCLSNIFKYLSIYDRVTIRKVCRRWGENRQLVWGDMKTLHFKNTSDELFSWPSCRTEFWEEIFEESQSFLRELKLENVASYVIFPPIAKYCENLTRLEIALQSREIMFRFNAMSFPQMEQLEYLKISGCGCNFSDNFFNTLPHKSLTELHLNIYWTGVSIRYRIPRASHSALGKLKKLSSLSLENFCLEPNVLMIINQMIDLISLSLTSCTGTKTLPPLNLPNLEKLNLMDVRRANDKFISKVSENCKNLKWLDLSNCHGLTDKGISQLRKLEKLEELLLMAVNNITDKHLSTMYNLRKLNCMLSKKIKDNGIMALVKNSPNLQEISLYESGVSHEVWIKADEIIAQRMQSGTV